MPFGLFIELKHVSNIFNVPRIERINFFNKEKKRLNELYDENNYRYGCFDDIAVLKDVTNLCVIIRETSNFIIVKTLSPITINWGYGPTIPSSYFTIHTKSNKIRPIYQLEGTPNTRELSYFLNTDEIVNPRWWSDDTYKIKKINNCQICFEENVVIVCSTKCNSEHQIGCQECIKLISKCPICGEPIKISKENILIKP